MMPMTVTCWLGVRSAILIGLGANFQSRGKYSMRSATVCMPSSARAFALAGPTPFANWAGVFSSMLFSEAVFSDEFDESAWAYGFAFKFVLFFCTDDKVLFKFISHGCDEYAGVGELVNER